MDETLLLQAYSLHAAYTCIRIFQSRSGLFCTFVICLEKKQSYRPTGVACTVLIALDINICLVDMFSHALFRIKTLRVNLVFLQIAFHSCHYRLLFLLYRNARFSRHGAVMHTILMSYDFNCFVSFISIHSRINYTSDGTYVSAFLF